MKILKLLLLFPFLILPIFGNAQSITYTPGPKNLDTSKFAHVYFIRDIDDEFPNNWVGVTLNNDKGLCVKAKMNSIYRVNTLLTGDNLLWTRIAGVKEEISLNLQPGKNYYVELSLEKQNDAQCKITMRTLDDAAGVARIQAFHNAVQNRYCILPFPGNNDFRENLYPDSMRWYASKKYEYHFLPLPSWEVILRSSAQTVLGFRNKLISNTYSEAGGIRYLSDKRFKTEVDFENYCNNEFTKTIIDNRKDSLISLTTAPVKVPEGIKYAKLISIENSSFSENSSNDQSLLIRSVYVVFFWTDQKGKRNMASLYTSERGLPEELHSLAELENRIIWSWQSFRLGTINKNQILAK